MTAFPAALPVLPWSAIDGVPPAEQLPRVVDRQRFAQHLACALIDQPSWELEAMARGDMAPLVKLRALQEDWPLVGTGQVVVLMRPAPLPQDPKALFAQATAQAPEALRAELAAVLDTLWSGEVPTPSPDAQRFIGDLLFQVAMAAGEHASSLAHAEHDRLVGRGA